MDTNKELNDKIIKITDKIRRDYPELLKYLNEMPETVPNEQNSEIEANPLKVYYDSLVDLMKDYDETHVKDLIPNTQIEEIPDVYPDLMTDFNNISLSYSYAGEGAVPVIFLHGFPFDKTMWKAQIDGLKNSCCVIALDIRGFGKSKDEISTLSIDLFAEDLVSFMDKLNIQKAIVCGLSMGGYIALNVVKRFPDRFEGLILCDTQCNADTPEIKEKRFETLAQINLYGADEFNENFIKSVFHPDTLKHKPELVENLRAVVFENSTRIISAGISALAERSETCSFLNEINLPTLIICGREDKLTPLTNSVFMHQNIKGSILKVIENAGHVSNLEQPEIFNTYIHDFLMSLNVLKYAEPNSEPLVPKVTSNSTKTDNLDERKS